MAMAARSAPRKVKMGDMKEGVGGEVEEGKMWDVNGMKGVVCERA